MKIIGWIWLIPFCLAAQNELTNMVLLEKKIAFLLDSLEISRITQGEGVQLSFGSVDGERRAFLKNGLIQYFSKRNVAVNPDSNFVRLNIEKFDVAFEYSEQPATFFGFKNKLQRRMHLQLQGWMDRPPAGNVLQTIDVDQFHEDDIRDSWRNRAEDGPYLFLRGEVRQHSRWTRYFEPALVLATVTSLVYLFFSMRS